MEKLTQFYFYVNLNIICYFDFSVFMACPAPFQVRDNKDFRPLRSGLESRRKCIGKISKVTVSTATGEHRTEGKVTKVIRRTLPPVDC